MLKVRNTFLNFERLQLRLGTHPLSPLHAGSKMERKKSSIQFGARGGKREKGPAKRQCLRAWIPNTKPGGAETQSQFNGAGVE